MSELDKIAGYTDPITGNHGVHHEVEGASTIVPASSPELKTLAAVAVGSLVVAALYLGRDVLIPLTLAVMLSFVLSPIVYFLQKLRLGRAPAVIVTVLAALGFLGLIGTLIGSQAASLTADAPQYAKTIEAKVQQVRVFAVGHLASITSQFGTGKPIRATPLPKPSMSHASESPAQSRPMPVEIVQTSASPLGIARTVLAPILGPLGTTIIVLIVAIFILMQKEDLRDRFIRVFGSSDLHRTTLAMDDAATRLSKYFLSQLAVNACFGVVIALGLWVIGIPSPAMWGIMAGFLRFVPYIGAFLAAVAPAALGAAVDPGWTMTIEVLALFAVIEPLTGYVVEPLLYGHSTGLSPVSVIVSAIFWSWIWGPIGLIMSTPLTLCLVVLGRHVKNLEIFDVLLGDRPALTPVESFYQRIVANNPDEALAQAEALLADRPLVAYYDGVVLEGLKLAVEDAARGTIDRPCSIRMARSMLSVIDDLQSYAEPAPDGEVDSATITVACIAGHGMFDDPVSAMLVQLLRMRGVAARAISNGAVSREMIASLDLSDVNVIAVSYLQLEGSPAKLRYLVRRLRGRAPNARIVVGLWPHGEAALTDSAIQNALGADSYVGSLAAALEDIAPARGSLTPASAAA